MRALTLHQPWASLVAMGHKPIENRSWKPPAWLYGQRFAIHAGMRWDAAAAVTAEALAGITLAKQDVPFGCVVAVVSVADVVTSEFDADIAIPGSAKWFFGPFGWVLENVVQLEQPVPCRGYQKLWHMPLAVEIDVGFGRDVRHNMADGSCGLEGESSALFTCRHCSRTCCECFSEDFPKHQPESLCCDCYCEVHGL